jgi:hypothetical protein
MFPILPLQPPFGRLVSFHSFAARSRTWAKAQRNPPTPFARSAVSLLGARANPNPTSPSIPISTAPWIPNTTTSPVCAPLPPPPLPGMELDGDGRDGRPLHVPPTFLLPPFFPHDPGRAHLSSS